MRRQRNDPLAGQHAGSGGFRQTSWGRLAETPPELLTAWHWLTAVENGDGFRPGLFHNKREMASRLWKRPDQAIQAKTGGPGMPD